MGCQRLDVVSERGWKFRFGRNGTLDRWWTLRIRSGALRTEHRKLQGKYPDVAGAEEIETIFRPPRALELYLDIVKPGSERPTVDFSIKSLAK
jgi:hypothetical protein